MKKIALISLGCSKNLVDSEVMLGHLNSSGYGFVPEPVDADVVIINTCGFIQPAQDEAEDSINQILLLKKENPSLKIIATGCYVQREEAQLKTTFPQVDSWLGVNDFDKISSLIEDKPLSRRDSTFLYDHRSPRIVTTSPFWAYVKISEGCSHHCSFCSIPLIKGPYQSRSVDSLVEEVEQLAALGIKEINLISQDTTFFGHDINATANLSNLLKRLLRIDGIEWIRFLYGYPEEITEELLDVMNEDKICSYLDIPFQHSHPRIIKSMRRGMNGKKALNFLDRIRQKLPDVAVRTSLITGYPDEGEEEFRHLVEFVKAAQFDHLGLFTYCQEDGTSSSSLGDPVPEEEKKHRYEQIMKIQTEISYARNSKYMNRTLDVLLEKPDEEERGWIARSRFQAPEVDGVVYVEQVQEPGLRENPIRKVEIRERDVYDLYGVEIK